MLSYSTDAPMRKPKSGEALISVAAAGLDNTDINSRTAWYSKAVTEGLNAVGAGSRCRPRPHLPTGPGAQHAAEPSWVSLFKCWTYGSDCDGGFAQFTVAPSAKTYAVNCTWTDAEPASVPCAYSTAENMLHRAGVWAERVLVTGASGGVGSDAVQLAKRRSAAVIALAGKAKAAEAPRAIWRETLSLRQRCGEPSILGRAIARRPSPLHGAIFDPTV